MLPFTIVVAVDAEHLKELRVTFPDWIEYKKEFREYPIKIIYDQSVSLSDLDQFKLPNVEFVFWDSSIYPTQREAMLTALTVLPPQICTTKWFLKIDTDTFALSDTEWVPELDDESFCFASPWGYSKPANVVDILDTWSEFVKLPGKPLALPYKPEDNSIKCSRFISWLYFGNVEQHKFFLKYFLVKGKYILPVPSQDTTLWYIADRLGLLYHKVKFKNLGWTHKKVVFRK